ncbi:MAG: hypothetical protein MAG431_01216 [Chloroflexi bacterium]|nr:hypothetical protein [Chloroflexota bacterium]
MSNYKPIPDKVEHLGKSLLDAAFEVHTVLGAGYLERIYEEALCHELSLRHVPFEQQKPITVPYKDLRIKGQRLDLIIGDLVIVELKAVESIHPIHQAQLMSYLKATDLRLGFILNFNVPHLKNGIKRIVM